MLHSYAPEVERDSILALVAKATFDPSVEEGRLRRWKYEEVHTDSDVHYIVPFIMPPGDSAPAPAPASREELENSGLGHWLAIWDEVLPAWPIKTWHDGGTDRMYEYPRGTIVEDAGLLSRDLVSISPDGVWRLHPFYGAAFTPDGKIGFDADSGFVLYRSSRPQRGRQYVDGTTTNFMSAEWIDSTRFVVAGVGMVFLEYGKSGVEYRAPFLCFGSVDSLETISIYGPPVSVLVMPAVRKRLDAYTHQRYPKFWEANR